MAIRSQTFAIITNRLIVKCQRKLNIPTKYEKNRTKPRNRYFLVLFENRTKPGTVLSETVLSGDPLYVHSEVFYEQGPPWQSGFLRLTLTGRKMQITILFEGGSEILRLYIFRGYTQFLWNAYWASAFASDITHYQFWGFSFTFWVWICNILILWENLWNCNA